MIRYPAIALGAVVLLAPPTLPAQDALGARMQELNTASRAGQHGRAVHLADSLAGVLPGHPSIILTRAVVLARAGRLDDARAAVLRLRQWDPRYARRALEDSALAPLRGMLVSDDITSLAARADRPVARGQAWAVLEERDLVPEGTAYDPATRSVLVGSLHKNKIVAIDASGRASDRVPAGRNGLRSVVGIHVDSARGILWATSNSRFDDQSDTTSSALYAFNAATGAFRARYPLPSGGAHFLNDLTTTPDGTVYVTDSQDGRVWVLKPGKTVLESFTEGGLLFPNGITTSADGRHLFLATGDHIRVFPLSGGEPWKLEVPDSINVTGIDGLAFVGDALIAHHPLGYWRIARYALGPGHRRITGRVLFEHMTPDARTSTTGEVVGAEYAYIGNSQIDRMNTKTIDSARMDPIRMYRVPLVPPRADVVAVALSARDSVALFDALTLDRLGTLPVGRAPHEIAVSPDGARAYVADAGASSITVLELPGRRVAATWPLPDSIKVHDVTVSADGRTVWAASGNPALVIELDATSGRVGRRFTLQRPGSWMLEHSRADGALVIGHLEGGAVTLLAPASGTERVLAGKVGEIDATTTPDGRQVWSVNVQDDSLTVFDLASGRATRQRSGRQAGRVILTPDGRTALTVNGGDSTVVAWDVATARRVGEVVVAGGPKVIALSRDGRRGYITHPQRCLLTLIDVPALRVLTTVAVPGTPDGVAVSGSR